jgi:serine phosphatase RsbU (regulator of sigma subunit)
VHVDAAREQLSFASAGHLPPLLIGPDGRAQLVAGGASTPLLAFREDVEAGSVALPPGAAVVLYTDGLVERRTEPIDDSLERLRAAAAGFEGAPGDLCDHLLAAMRPPEGMPRDDIAVIAFRRSSG